MLQSIKKLSVFIVLVMLLSSCAAVKSPVTGFLYTNVESPFAAPGLGKPTKVGVATATSYFGLIASGNASIEAACKAADITIVHHVDERVSSFLFLYAKYEVVVYGE